MQTTPSLQTVSVRHKEKPSGWMTVMSIACARSSPSSIGFADAWPSILFLLQTKHSLNML